MLVSREKERGKQIARIKPICRVRKVNHGVVEMRNMAPKRTIAG